MAVQQSWEQHNKSEEIHGYRTFRSTIHCTMVPIICAELALTRADWDKIQDAELIIRLDKILQPTGPVDFLIKLRTIKFNHADAKTPLVHRYRAFAEPFLQLPAEAQDAGCPINGEFIKLAYAHVRWKSKYQERPCSRKSIKYFLYFRSVFFFG